MRPNLQRLFRHPLSGIGSAALWLGLTAPSALAAVAGATDSATPSPLATMPPMPSPPPFVLTPPPELSVWPYLVQLVLFTLFMGALAFFGLRFLRDRFPSLQLGLGLVSSTGLKVIDRVAVDPKHTVFVVSLGKRAWLLAGTESHITTVAELSQEDLGGEFAAIVEKEASRRDIS
jgi:flagellar biogenesis protein FliO